MKNRILWLGGLLFFCTVLLQAQELKVESFNMLERDLLARTAERLDLNDVPCAVLRVSVADAKSFTFTGNVIGDVVYQPGEAIVYLSAGSRNLTINSEKFGSLKFDFPERLKKQVVYKLTMKLILSEDQKIRTLVMPVMGVGSTPSYGLMVGVVRKTGAYVKAKYNFRSLGADYECDGNGVVAGTDEPSWFTGKSKESRLALTAGVLQRIQRPIYLYAGLGYGYKKQGWEMADSEWAESRNKSYKGLEIEAGGIYRLKNLGLSAGIQTNQFKYWEATLGVGIMF